MGFIGEIIKETLESMPDDFLSQEAGKGMAAQQCEEIIITNVIYQFATMVGGALDFDEDGQAIVYTNHIVASQSQDAENQEEVNWDEILTEENDEESP